MRRPTLARGWRRVAAAAGLALTAWATILRPCPDVPADEPAAVVAAASHAMHHGGAHDPVPDAPAPHDDAHQCPVAQACAPMLAPVLAVVPAGTECVVARPPLRELTALRGVPRALDPPPPRRA